MRNYIRSEFYRITRSKELYLTALLLALFPVSANILLVVFGEGRATTSFSYSVLLSNPMLFVFLGSMIPFIFYESNLRNGTLKNVIANGIGRTKIFLSQSFISLLFGTVLLITTLSAYVLTAELLLKKGGLVTAEMLVKESLAVYLIAVTPLVLSTAFNLLYKGSFLFGILLYFLWNVVPSIFVGIGMHVKEIASFARLLPAILFKENVVTSTEIFLIWDTADGLFRCIVSGIIGIIFFLALGIFLFRRKDI